MNRWHQQVAELLAADPLTEKECRRWLLAVRRDALRLRRLYNAKADAKADQVRRWDREGNCIERFDFILGSIDTALADLARRPRRKCS